MRTEKRALELPALGGELLPARLNPIEILRIVIDAIETLQIRHQDLQLGDISRGGESLCLEIDHQRLGVPEGVEHLAIGLDASNPHIRENVANESSALPDVVADFCGAYNGQTGEEVTNFFLVVPERIQIEVHRCTPRCRIGPWQHPSAMSLLDTAL